jgi:putative hemolysin
MIEKLDIQYRVDPNEIAHIPAEGRLMIIANHITGASDAFSLVQAIGRVRKNKKVRLVVNGMLMGVKQASEIIIPVDNINGSISKSSLKAITQALRNKEVVVIFPSGIVNRFGIRGIKDNAWKSSFLKFARHTDTPILPVKIDARNSLPFYLSSLVLPKKITGFLLPHEFVTAGKRRPLTLHIGKVIPVDAFSDKSISLEDLVTRFYRHLYRLGTKKEGLLPTIETIAAPYDRVLLCEEIHAAESLGKTSDGMDILIADPASSPTIIKELGRVREISFRAIGGGTGKSRDNDLYDTYYKHLLLWDDEAMEIVGAYRIGECETIIEQKGKKGLYTYNQCNFNEHFNSLCDQTVEMGRSFVQPKYWGSRALDNLWQGIGTYFSYNPQIRYTYGTVTINADTPPKAVAALVYFYTLRFSCESNMMTAKTPYRFDDEERYMLSKMFDHLDYKEGFIVLKQYLKSMGTSVPTLFKQYVELYDEGAVRFFDFSVNEKLLGVVEGFIMMDVSKMKQKKRERYLRSLQKSVPLRQKQGRA